MADNKLKVAFPVITLPVNLGARRAVLVVTKQHPAAPNVLLATCLDAEGRVYNDVPLAAVQVMKAAQKPVLFVEQDGEADRKPAGSIIIPG